MSSITGKDDKRQIVYLVDEFSKWTVGKVVKDKHPEVVVKVVLDSWCLNGMGYPSNSFFVDNGGEFQGKGLEACAQRLGIMIKKTAAYAPWSNGSNERKHSTIDLTLKKMITDNPTAKIDDLLQHAVWSKNIE